jgi:hypothetical protein
MIVSLGRDHTKTHLIDLFSRMEARLARQAHRLLTDLLKLQALRQQAPNQRHIKKRRNEPNAPATPSPSHPGRCLNFLGYHEL